jgi:hypothetical protein
MPDCGNNRGKKNLLRKKESTNTEAQEKSISTMKRRKKFTLREKKIFRDEENREGKSGNSIFPFSLAERDTGVEVV